MSFFKYLTSSQMDHKWGINIKAGGFEQIKPGAKYPNPDHPSTYFFNFDTGRVLNEYQFLYITRGQGILTTESAGRMMVKEGSMFILYPNEWHTYKPDVDKGWDEYWFGTSGPVIENIMAEQDFFSIKSPLLEIGYREYIFQLYNQMIETIKNEPPGFQQIVSGIAIPS